MVRRIQLVTNETDFETLKALKGKKTWEQFLIEPILKEAEG